MAARFLKKRIGALRKPSYPAHPDPRAAGSSRLTDRIGDGSGRGPPDAA
jgi:hypothetical protein